MIDVVYRWIARVCIMATGLTLAGCNESSDKFVAPEQKAMREPAPTGEKGATRKPLDLSLPLQPAAVPGSSDNTGASRESILPDLFQQEQKPDDDRSIHVQGRVLMKPGEEQNLDSMEGGQFTIEMKTR